MNTKNLPETTIKYLQSLAQKYENHSFIENDPSQFLYKFPSQEDTEVLAFIAAMLSFGKREQFIKKINYICNLTHNSPFLWIKNKIYLQNFIPETESPTSPFYRFYTFQDMTVFFQEFSEILEKNSTFGEFLKSTYEQDSTKFLDQLISNSFPKSKIVAK